MVNKLGQVKIQQMAFMLMAITLFFVFVGLFILSIKFNDLKQSAETLDQKNALYLTSKIASYPELACGTAYGSQKINCIDTDKLIIFLEKQEEYSNFWEVENLIVRKIYPESEEICNAENYPDCGIFNLLEGSNKGDVSTFVSLCRTESENQRHYTKCELGKIFVGF
ncbi:MAG: hypothetical protein U9Q99_02225 [Nanoarchaeota archaeon]|nr:hypothetical protein [Nanoarchaeota archaeon]